MFTIKSISYEDGIKCELSVYADYYEVKGHPSGPKTVVGYTNDKAITCHHEVFNQNDDTDSPHGCNIVYVTNKDGVTIDRIYI